MAVLLLTCSLEEVRDPDKSIFTFTDPRLGMMNNNNNDDDDPTTMTTTTNNDDDDDDDPTTMMTTDDSHQEGGSNDNGYVVSSPSLPNITDFEFQECKTEPETEPEPCSDMDDPFENQSAFDKSFAPNTPVPVLGNPIILLERCDKIWETLQLIKTVQNPIALGDDHSEEKEEASKDEQTSLCVESESTSKSGNIVPLPFQFSVKRSKKVFPCITCGKQYMEARSLRRHSEKVHGIVIPLKRRKRRLANKKESLVTLRSKENCDSEELYDNAKVCGKTEMPESETKFSTTNSLKRRRNMIRNINFTNNQEREKTKTESSSPATLMLTRCTLCRQKVMSVRKHLIHYHKIGCSSSMMKQLESSLLTDNETSSNNNKAILGDAIKNRRDKIYTNNNDSETKKMPQVRKKRKYTSYVNTKRKYNIERYVSIQNMYIPSQKHKSLSDISYKCDICLGIYASANSFTKHKRCHRIRGETKENFHKFKCRYFNSPLNENCRLSSSSTKSTDTAVKNTNDKTNRDLRLHNSKIFLNQNGKVSKARAAMYNGKMSKKNDTTCLCGRIFRNPYTLFVHKKKCNLYSQEDIMEQHVAKDNYSSDRDSGIGINVITIKKRNNSYEIVGKDGEEDKVRNPEQLNDSTLSSSAVDHNVKDSTNANSEQSNTSELSEYSKDHSVLKLQVAEEDIIIDIEDDVQVMPDKNNEVKKMIKKIDNKSYLEKCLGHDAKDESNSKDSTLKQIHQEVLNELAMGQKPELAMGQKPELAMEQKSELATIRQGNKMNLRSTQNTRKKYNYSFKDTDDDTTEFDPFSRCGYCNKSFSTVSSYNNHRCTIKVGKQFDKFSLNLLCFCCNDVLNNCNKFDEHMRIKHFDSAYYCYLCPSRFASEKERNRHSRMEHDRSCRFCHKKLTISVKVLHEAYHFGFGYPCHQCKKAYAFQKNLLYHNSTIHKNEADNKLIYV